MSNRTINIMIFSSLVLIAGVIAYKHTQGIKADVEKSW